MRGAATAGAAVQVSIPPPAHGAHAPPVPGALPSAAPPTPPARPSRQHKSRKAALALLHRPHQLTALPHHAAALDCREFYADLLIKYGIAARRLPWNNLADEEDMMAALHNGTLE